MMVNKTNETLKNIITSVKCDQEFQISSKDTFYVYADDFVKGVQDVTEEEVKISNHLLSIIGSSKSDEEDILIVTSPSNLFNILVNFQRIILDLKNLPNP